jgi:hypothetical protein
MRFEQLVLRWQGRHQGEKRVIIIEVCESKDGGFKIHLPGLPRPGKPITPESYWNLEHYSNVEKAKRDGIATATNRAGIQFKADQVNWVHFNEPDAPTRDAPC